MVKAIHAILMLRKALKMRKIKILWCQGDYELHSQTMNYKYITLNPLAHTVPITKRPAHGIGMDILRNHPLQVSHILVIKLAFHAI